MLTYMICSSPTVLLPTFGFQLLGDDDLHQKQGEKQRKNSGIKHRENRNDASAPEETLM
jgi:hypothetical protein